MRRHKPIDRTRLFSFRIRKLLRWEQRTQGSLPESTLTALDTSGQWKHWGYESFAECLVREYGLRPHLEEAEAQNV